jgi:hypothetical protein
VALSHELSKRLLVYALLNSRATTSNTSINLA